MNRGRGGRGLANKGRGRGGSNTSRPQGSGGRYSSPSTTPDSTPLDVVRPVLPPNYPDFQDGAQIDRLDKRINGLVKDYVRFKEYCRSNYSVEYELTKKSAFNVDKFTDNYDSPSCVNPRLLYKVDTRFLPKELYTKNMKLFRKKAELLVKKEAGTNVKEQPESSSSSSSSTSSGSDDEAEDEQQKEVRKRKLDQVDTTKEENKELENAAKSGSDDDDDEDEVDEEMDEGNDYLNDYFNNGEDYISEDDALEEGDVF